MSERELRERAKLLRRILAVQDTLEEREALRRVQAELRALRARRVGVTLGEAVYGYAVED